MSKISCFYSNQCFPCILCNSYIKEEADCKYAEPQMFNENCPGFRKVFFHWSDNAVIKAVTTPPYGGKWSVE